MMANIQDEVPQNMLFAYDGILKSQIRKQMTGQSFGERLFNNWIKIANQRQNIWTASIVGKRLI